MTHVSQLLDRKGRAIYSIEPEDPVLEAIRLMAEHHVGALLVMKGDELVGIVSERDYARKVILHGALVGRDAGVADHELAGPHRVPAPHRAGVHAAHDRARVRHLPVVEADQVVGMVSIGDLVKAVMEEQQQTIEQLESYIHR